MSEELVPRDSHLVTDSQGIIQSANQEAANMLNLSQRVLIGRHLPALLALDEHFQSRLQEFEKTESGLEWEMTLAPNGRASFSAWLTISAMRGPSGRIDALHWLIRDVSVRKRLEAGDQLLQDLGEHVLEGVSLSQSLLRLCHQLVQRFSYPLVWVARREADGEISVCARAGESRLNPDPSRDGLTDEERRGVEAVLETHETFIFKRNVTGLMGRLVPWEEDHTRRNSWFLSVRRIECSVCWPSMVRSRTHSIHSRFNGLNNSRGT